MEEECTLKRKKRRRRGDGYAGKGEMEEAKTRSGKRIMVLSPGNATLRVKNDYS